MPQIPFTAQERRLAAFCRVLAVLYFAAAAAFALLLQPLALLAGILAVSLMAALGTTCLVAATRPRERRHAVLPAVVAQLVTFALSAGFLLAGRRAPGLSAAAAVNFPLFLLTSFLYRSAAPGVRSAPAAEGLPPEAESPARIQLKVSK